MLDEVLDASRGPGQPETRAWAAAASGRAHLERVANNGAELGGRVRFLVTGEMFVRRPPRGLRGDPAAYAFSALTGRRAGLRARGPCAGPRARRSPGARSVRARRAERRRHVPDARASLALCLRHRGLRCPSNDVPRPADPAGGQTRPAARAAPAASAGGNVSEEVLEPHPAELDAPERPRPPPRRHGSGRSAVPAARLAVQTRGPTLRSIPSSSISSRRSAFRSLSPGSRLPPGNSQRPGWPPGPRWLIRTRPPAR